MLFACCEGPSSCEVLCMTEMMTFSCLCFHTAGEWTCIALRAGPFGKIR